MLADPESLNPLTSNDAGSSMVLGQIMTTFLTLDPKALEPIPLAAADLPEVAADHLTYRFRLRDGVTFSDGRPITVEDVLFSVKAIKDPEVNAPQVRNYYVSVESAQAIDDRTVEFRCREPYFRNDTVLGNIALLPRHYYDPEGLLDDLTVAELDRWESLGAEKKDRAVRFARAFNRDFHRRAMGGGAYVLADPSRDLATGEKVVLTRRANFWAPNDPLRGDGWVDKMYFRIINNPDAALLALKAGTLDYMTLTPLQHLKQTDTPGFRQGFAKEIAYTPSYSYVGWNMTRGPLREKLVRQALNHFVDRDRIIEKVIFGFGEKIDSPVYRFRPEYNQDVTGYAFDPALGRKKLEAAGWVDTDGDGVRDKVIDGKRVPLRLEIISNSGNEIRAQIGLIVIDQLRRNGVGATFRGIDWSIMLEKVSNFDFDAVILGWLMSVNDPDLFQLWHSSQAVPGGSNSVGFKNAEADRILEEYRRTFDEEERTRLYRRVQEIIHEEAPYCFLYMPKGISAHDKRFQNTVWYATGGPNVNEWWVPGPLQRWGK
jgi:peptide/nickel transport system substrate-binding protein